MDERGLLVDPISSYQGLKSGVRGEIGSDTISARDVRKSNHPSGAISMQIGNECYFRKQSLAACGS